MAGPLTGRHFLKLLDFTPDEIRYLLDESARLKADKKAGRRIKVDQRLLKKRVEEYRQSTAAG